jgi:hypothetical protein
MIWLTKIMTQRKLYILTTHPIKPNMNDLKSKHKVYNRIDIISGLLFHKIFKCPRYKQFIYAQRSKSSPTRVWKTEKQLSKSQSKKSPQMMRIMSSDLHVNCNSKNMLKRKYQVSNETDIKRSLPIRDCR